MGALEPHPDRRLRGGVRLPHLGAAAAGTRPRLTRHRLGLGRAATAGLLEVTSPDGRSWATAEGAVTLVGPGTDPYGPEVEALVDHVYGARLG
ncbi:hypothetical protein [Frankia sp. EI5c]|uniref:hypothetical protein n=1 Tax=Frankia sp. EI5c TaxID=683316 RepID=UPI0037BE5436